MLLKKLTLFILCALLMFLLGGCGDSEPPVESVSRESVPVPKEITGKIYMEEGGKLELPLNGATGYASVSLQLRRTPDSGSEQSATLPAGTAFRIIAERGDWWQIANKDIGGWVRHQFCLINLPDVIPSIVYDNTNTYASKLASSGKAIPEITGQPLYQGKTWNPRLGRNEYIMPVIYGMAEKICAAQQLALADGNTLKIYEGYRPHSVQKRIVEQLRLLSQKDDTVRRGISSPPWGINWFIATTLSNHQRGIAIDVSLAKIITRERRLAGEYLFRSTSEASEYRMPTPIHELSIASAALSAPVSAKSATQWREIPPAKSMTPIALALRDYCTNSGLTPLASEWWHFNDLDAYRNNEGNRSNGQYILIECYSAPPQ